MSDRENTDYLTAFAIGAVLGVGAALLLRPRRKTRVERLMKEVEPYRKKVAKRAKRAGKALDAGMDEAAERGGALADAGRDVLERFRDELVHMASAAQDEIDAMISERMKEARKGLKRRAEKLRS